MAKKLMQKRNQYAFPGSPNPGRWGQLLVFDDGSTEFDEGHRQNAAIAHATQQATGSLQMTFKSGAVAKDAAGNWVPA